MKKKIIAVAASAALIILGSVVALSLLASGTTVFSDNFSSGSFASWTRSFQSPGSSQAVSNSVAHFTVPTPLGGAMTYSYVVKDGFTSSVNSTIVASQDILLSKVPTGFAQGNSAIFFLYICDSADLGGNCGNFGVGIDGSGVWSLWIGGNTTYTYVFQTSGPVPASNTWYRVALTADNSAGTVSVAINGVTVISATQQQLTDRAHAFSLMSGMGENWWSQTSGQLELDVANVQLEISDGSPAVTYNPTYAPTYTPTNPTSTATNTASPQPTTTPKPSPTPTTNPSTPSVTTPTPIQATGQEFPMWILLPVTILVVVSVEIVFLLRKK